MELYKQVVVKWIRARYSFELLWWW